MTKIEKNDSPRGMNSVIWGALYLFSVVLLADIYTGAIVVIGFAIFALPILVIPVTVMYLIVGIKYTKFFFVSHLVVMFSFMITLR